MKKILVTGFLLTLLFCFTAAAVSETPNLEITATRVEEGPNIDGQLTDDAWLEAALKGSKFVQDVNHEGDVLTEYPRVGYIAYDDQAIYIAYVIYAPDIDALETSGEEPFHNDEIEIFIQAPDMEYFQIGIDAGGQYSISEPGPEDIEFEIYHGEIKWRVEVAIAFEDIGVTPEPGDTWKIGLCGRQIAVGDLWLTWNPTYGSFHNPDRFGTLIFGER